MNMRTSNPKTRLNNRVANRARPLRAETLVNAARAELARMGNLSPKTDPINILRLARRLGVTRQALYNNDLQAVVAEYAELQRKNFSAEVEAAVRRRPLEERIRRLRKGERRAAPQTRWLDRAVGNGGIQCAAAAARMPTNSSSRFRRRRARRSPSEKGGKLVDEMNE